MTIQVGKWRAVPELNKLRDEASEVALAPKEMDLLVYLAQHSGEVVSPDQISREVWNDVPLSDDTIYVTISRLRRALGDSARQPSYIETIPKRGYRLVAYVSFEKAVRGRHARTVFLFAAGIGGLALLLSMIGDFDFGEAPSHPPKSIAVLPFANLSYDPGQDYLADGISEEVLNELAQIPGLRVAARTSSFQFQGEKLGIVEIARQLHVGYVLEGSLRKESQNVRITAQLISADDGYHIWSRTFDRGQDRIFTVQREIARAVSSTLDLAPNVENGADSRRSTTDPLAFDYYLKASALIRSRDPDDLTSAIGLLQTAVELDPRFADAHSRLGQAYLFEDAADAEERGIGSLIRAVEIDPGSASALAVLGYFRLLKHWNWDSADELMQRAYAAGPLNSDVLHFYSIYLSVTGRLTESLAVQQEAASLDPLNLSKHGSVGQRHIYLDQFDQALGVYLDTKKKFPESDLFDFRLADVYRYLGRLDDAQRVIDEMGVEVDQVADIRYRFLMADAREDTDAATAITNNEILPLAEAGEYPFHWCADSLVRLGRFEEGMAWYQRAVDRRHRSFLRYVLYPLPNGLVERAEWRELWQTPPLDGLRARQIEAGEMPW